MNNILFVVTGSVQKRDLSILRKAGVLVCEIDNIENARFVMPAGTEQPVDWLACALEAMANIEGANGTRHEFIKLVAARYGIDQKPIK